MSVEDEKPRRQRIYDGLTYDGSVRDLAGSLARIFPDRQRDADGSVDIKNEPKRVIIGKKMGVDDIYGIGFAKEFNSGAETVIFKPEPYGIWPNQASGGPDAVLLPVEYIRWDFVQT